MLTEKEYSELLSKAKEYIDANPDLKEILLKLSAHENEILETTMITQAKDGNVTKDELYDRGIKVGGFLGLLEILTGVQLNK